MESQKPKLLISPHWAWIPPAIILALAICMRVIFRARIELLSAYLQSAVDVVVVLCPVLGFIIPVCLLARKRMQRQDDRNDV